MTLTFAKTHNMIAYLTKSNAREGFNQIINFLNGSSIKYALTVNPNIYVSCIKQFWTLVAVKKVNDITRLQALVDKKKVLITEASIRDALHLDDAEGIECLPNEEIFAELTRMRYEKPSTKLTFYKAFFSSQWKFLIHSILQCMSVKRTSWNKFSSSMASAVICLSICRMFNFSKYIFDSLVRNVDSPTKFYMDPRFLQLMIRKQVGDLSTHTINGTVAEGDDDEVYVKDVNAVGVATESVEEESEPAEPQEVVDVVTTAKIITEVVTAITAASTTITAADVLIPTATTAAAPILIDAPSRRRKGVVIRDPEENTTTSTIIHSEAKSKDKGKWILVEEPKPLKKQAQIEQDEKYARELEAELNKNIDWYEVIDHVKRKQKEDNEQMDEEDSRALKRLNESQEEKAAKKLKLDEDVKELKRHLQIVPNDEDDIYTKATPLARKVPVVDYEIYNENNKPYYKIKRADERRYPLTRFTLDQMLNNVRLEVVEESEVSLELLRFIRQQHQEGAQLE
nr:hypothetical protein [Tanacetum cinerariifolium]